MKINKVCILGAGTLGSRIALQSVISGFEVRVYDIQESAFEASRKMMAKVLKQSKWMRRLSIRSYSRRIPWKPF